MQIVVKVRLFAMMAQHARTGTLSVELPAGSSLGSIQAELLRRHPKMPWPEGTMLALNQEYADPAIALNGGDEVAVIPPVSGGGDER